MYVTKVNKSQMTTLTLYVRIELVQIVISYKIGRGEVN